MQQIATLFAAQSCSSEQLANILKQQQNSNEDYLDRKFQQLEIYEAERKRRNDYLASLYYPDIDRRQEEVKDAHQETFQWIFDQSGEEVRPWSNFVDWLEGGSGIYWINGKPGSGKSTLMSYICQDERTKHSLSQWAAKRNLSILTFFFWAAGTELQHSTTGLLRSLIYQLLEKNPTLFDSSILGGATQDLRTSPEQSLKAIGAWTDRRLLKLFWKLIETFTETKCACVFIDGLDELRGDPDPLIEIIFRVAQRANVKCCISSRPEKPFQVFGKTDMLRLQDLTRSDIQAYVQSKLENVPRIETLSREDDPWKQELIKAIVSKADGVFLWVELAVKSQILGIKYNDSRETLSLRLASLPGEIEGLYEAMLKRVDPLHHKEAARYLQLTILSRKSGSLYFPTVLNISIVMYGLKDDGRLGDSMKTADVNSKCSYVKNRINDVCAGFLEVSELGEPDSDEDGPTLSKWDQDVALQQETDKWSRCDVTFIHRTALEFFASEAGSGSYFLSSYLLDFPFPEVHTLSASLCLARMSMCNLVDSEHYMRYMINVAMEELKEAEDICSSTDEPLLMQLLDYVNETIGGFDKDHNVPDGSHWCTRWGYVSIRSYHILPKAREPWANSVCSRSEFQDKYPNDFISYAASRGLFKYVNSHLSEPHSKVSTYRATQLAVCSLISPEFGYRGKFGCGRFRKLQRQQLEIVTRLTGLGANPNAGYATSIWEEVVGYLLHLRLEKPQAFFRLDINAILTTFLATGIDPYPTVRLVFSVPSKSSTFAAIECDTSRVSFVQYTMTGTGAFSSPQNVDRSQRRADSARPLRICFFDFNGDSCWPQNGHYLTDKQNIWFYESLEAAIGMNQEDASHRLRPLRSVLRNIMMSCQSEYEDPNRDSPESSEHQKDDDNWTNVNEGDEEVKEDKEDKEDDDDDEDDSDDIVTLNDSAYEDDRYTLYSRHYPI